MCDYDYETDEDQIEADRRKERVGMAERGSDEYYRNAAYVLRAYSEPNPTTESKLRWLESHGY